MSAMYTAIQFNQEMYKIHCRNELILNIFWLKRKSEIKDGGR